MGIGWRAAADGAESPLRTPARRHLRGSWSDPLLTSSVGERGVYWVHGRHVQLDGSAEPVHGDASQPTGDSAKDVSEGS